MSILSVLPQGANPPDAQRRYVYHILFTPALECNSSQSWYRGVRPHRRYGRAPPRHCGKGAKRVQIRFMFWLSKALWLACDGT